MVDNSKNEEADNLNEKQENNVSETSQIVISEPAPITIEEYNQKVFSLALEVLTEEETIKLIGVSKNDPSFFEKLKANEKASNALLMNGEYLLSQYLNQIDEYALNGKVNKSYTMLLELADFSDNDYLYIKAVADPINCLENRFNNIENISNQIDFLERVAKINSGESISNPSIFCSKLIEYESNLFDEQKAKLNMLCAQTFKGNLYTPYGIVSQPVALDYKLYLEKAINFSSDYNTIADCHRNIETLGSIKNDRFIKDAYKRAITKAKKEKNNKAFYNANKKLAIMHKQDAKYIGFKYEASDSYKSLKKAEQYYINAIAAEKKETKKYNINDLKELAHIQKTIENDDGWVDTKRKLANSLVGVDKYKVLISILPKMKKGRLEYINMLSQKISKGSIPVKDKDVLLNNLEKIVGSNINDNSEKKAAQTNILNARNEITKKTLKIEKKER